ncbi:MAG: hypothetical protein LBI72_05310 [Flavobacteriaceae bacterium]|jgi:hypothetical protein|nr:hypothetical protein [Flavobacteriaceae bacterium]
MQNKVRKNGTKTNLEQERKLVIAAAKDASATAVRISTALELPIQVVKGDTIVEQRADGSVVELKKVQKVKSNINFTKGSKICLQPND